MPKKINASDLDHARTRRGNGASWTTIGRELRLHSESIREASIVAGFGGGRVYRPAPNAKPFPQDKCLAAYRAGASVNALAGLFGVQRATMRYFLERQGEPIRGRSAASVTRFEHTSKELRQAQTKRANVAARGQPLTLEHQLRLAKTRCRRIGIGEVELARSLRERGFGVTEQVPIHIYNVDLLVGPVVVELRCDAAFPTKFERQRVRLEHILGAGYPVLYICFREYAAVQACLNYIVADLHGLHRLPSGRGQYRMVWCALQRFARRRNELGQLTCVPTPIQPIHRTRECDLGLTG
jgi:hypothetical protein